MYVAGRGSLSPPAIENDFWIKNNVFYCSLVSVFYCSLVFNMFFFSHFLFIIGVFGLAYAHRNKSLNLIFFLQFWLFINVWKCVFLFFFSGFFFFVFFLIAMSGSVYTHHIFFLTYIYIFYNRGRLHAPRIILGQCYFFNL